MIFIKRQIEPVLLSLLEQRPIVYLNGARQCGKSTLVKYLSEIKLNAQYFTFDQYETRMTAQSSPMEF